MVHLNVEVAQHVLITRIGHSRTPLLVFMKAEKHVLEAVGNIEHAYHGAAPRFAQCVEKHDLALLMNILRLAKKRILANDTFVQSRSIFGDAKRRKWPLSFRQIDRVGNWM